MSGQRPYVDADKLLTWLAERAKAQPGTVEGNVRASLYEGLGGRIMGGQFDASDEPELRCRECIEGKHGACNGIRFDEHADEWRDCACEDVTHQKAWRFQLSRARGARMPEGGVSCARPHRYGNPFVVATPENGGNITQEQAVDQFARALAEGRLQFDVAEVRRELAGKPLGCFCSPPLPCHVDVLVRVANGGKP